MCRYFRLQPDFPLSRYRVVRGGQSAICPEVSFSYKDSPLQGKEAQISCQLPSLQCNWQQRNLYLCEPYAQEGIAFTTQSWQMSPCCLLVLNLLKLLYPVPQVYLPLCYLFFTTQTIHSFSFCLCISGDLLLPVLKTKPVKALAFLDMVLALTHELNSTPVSIKLISVKLPSEYSLSRGQHQGFGEEKEGRMN